jgi:site-specific DNA recombinase
MAYDAIRDLIEKVVIRPGGPYKPVEIDIYGRIQALFPRQEQETGESMGGVGCGGRI